MIQHGYREIITTGSVASLRTESLEVLNAVAEHMEVIDNKNPMSKLGDSKSFRGWQKLFIKVLAEC